MLLYRTLGYTGIRTHTGPREFQSRAQKQLTSMFRTSLVFEYVYRISYVPDSKSLSQPNQSGITAIDCKISSSAIVAPFLSNLIHVTVWNIVLHFGGTIWVQATENPELTVFFCSITPSPPPPPKKN